MCSNINEYSERKPLHDRDSKLKKVVERWEKEETENKCNKE